MCRKIRSQCIILKMKWNREIYVRVSSISRCAFDVIKQIACYDDAFDIKIIEKKTSNQGICL